MFQRPAQLLALLVIIGGARGVCFAAASWDQQPYSITVPTHVAMLGQSCTGSVDLKLQHSTSCTLMVSVAQSGNEVLTLDASNTLSTCYMLVGSALQNPDATWVSSTNFLTHVYNVLGNGPEDTLTLSVKGTAPSDHAAEAGTYNASLIFTVSW